MFLDDVVMDKNIDCSGWGKHSFQIKKNQINKFSTQRHKMTIATRTK